MTRAEVVDAERSFGSYNDLTFNTAGPELADGRLNVKPLLAGTYRTPAIYCVVKGMFTHTVPVDAYRGAGRPEASYLLERLVDVAARETGIDKVALRRRNFIPADSFP